MARQLISTEYMIRTKRITDGPMKTEKRKPGREDSCALIIDETKLCQTRVLPNVFLPTAPQKRLGVLL